MMQVLYKPDSVPFKKEKNSQHYSSNTHRRFFGMLILTWDDNLWLLFRKERIGGDWVKYEHFFASTTLQPIIANNCQAPITPIISHGCCLDSLDKTGLAAVFHKVRTGQNNFF